MSSLYRSAISSRIAKLPQLPPIDGPEDDDEGEENDALGALPTPVPAPGLGPPAMPRRTPAASRSRFTKSTPNPAFAPISASAYFSQALQVSVKSTQSDVRIYYTPPAALSIESSVMICHHGAGYSGLSFACFAKEVLEMTQGECGVLALDARRHGRTTCSDPNGSDENLSVEVLTNDLVELLKEVFPDPAASPSFVVS
jgi:protein phosphatase methylesterase 1